MEQHRDEHLTCADCGAPFLFSASEATVFAERGLASPKRCKDCRRARKERNQQQQGGFEGGGGGGGFGRPRQDGGGARFQGGPPRPQGRPEGGFAPSYGNAGARAPRYTGDVNEYRSPMADNGYAANPAPWGSDTGFAARRPAPAGGPRFQGAPAPWPKDGRYRSPGGPRPEGGFDRGAPRTFERSPQAFDRGGPQGGFDRGAPQGGFDRGAPQGGFDRGGQGGFDRGAPQGGFDRGAPQGGFDRGAAAAPRRRPQAEMFSITCNSCGIHAEVPFRPAEGRDVFCQACYRARKPV
jgi:CxxC-x17-CxxC domain-containing protein